MIWLNNILKIFLEEKLLTRYYVMKHLIFLTPPPPSPKKDQKLLDSVTWKFFDEKSVACTNTSASNQQEQRLILIQFLRTKYSQKNNTSKHTVFSPFEDNIWGFDLADKQLINKFNIHLSLINEFNIHYMLLIPLLNMHKLFLWKTEEVLQLQRHFKKF